MKAGAIVLALVLVHCGSTAVLAQTAKSSWWNPWTSDETPSSNVRDSSFFDASEPSSDTSWFKLPKPSWPDFGKSESNKKSRPSTISKMTRSTKKMWDSTVDFMNPFDSPSAKTPSSYEPHHQGYQPQKVETTSGKGMFGWMWREERTETPATINDWLSQPNPLLAK